MCTNPYRQRLQEFPERIFRFEDLESDISRTQNIIQAASKDGRRVYCEIGCGSGGHLVARASSCPSCIFFGMELRFKRAVRTIEKAEVAGAENLFMLRVHALRSSEIFPANSLSGIYLLFPDPWERRSQRKHRLVTEIYVRSIFQMLSPGGFFAFKSDHANYFEEVYELLARSGGWQIGNYPDHRYRPELAPGVTSEFEQLFVKQGLPIFSLLAIRA